MTKTCNLNNPDAQVDGCPYSTLIAKDAVRETFAILGVDIRHPDSLELLREDLRFGRKLRTASERGALAIIGVISAGAASAAWYMLENYFKGK